MDMLEQYLLGENKFDEWYELAAQNEV